MAKQKQPGPPLRNKNAEGKRVQRDRIAINLSVSEKNGLLELFQHYLSEQGIVPTDDAIKEVASQWAYLYWGERLKREIERQDATLIL